MKKLSVMWDTGHGSTINGQYQTLGKRSPDWEHGVLYEGVANRWITNKAIMAMDYERLPYYHLSPELEDTSLTIRSNRANKIYARNPNSYGISIHFNAGRGTGWEIFTSPGQTKSDYIANEFIEAFEDNMPIKARLGGTKFLSKDKEANYSILRRTNSPFILIECGFMDNPIDYAHIWDPKFQNLIAENLLKGIKNVNKKYGK